MTQCCYYVAGEGLIPFTEGNVLDAITKISHHYELGLLLKIPQHKLEEINQHPVEDRSQLFASALFRHAPLENLNWEKVNSAINEVWTSEWVAFKRSNSMTKSTSLESHLSSASTGGEDKNFAIVVHFLVHSVKPVHFSHKC